MLRLPFLLLAQAAPAEDGAETLAVTDQIAESEMGQAATSLWEKLTTGNFGAVTTGELIAFFLPVLQAIVLIIVVLIAAKWVKSIVVKGATKARVELTLAKFFGNIAKWAVLLLGVLTIFRTFGVEVTSFTAVLAGLTVGIGLALSGTLGNIAAGVMLLIFRPFKVGDVVNMAGVLGTVDEIELFTTAVDTFDKRRIIIPNNQIVGSIIENISYHAVRRVDVNVGVAYSADIDKTREVLGQAIASIDKVHADPEAVVFLGDLGDSAVNWTCRVWVDAPDFWDVKQALTRAVKIHLDQAGLGIPFPQRDIHLDDSVIEALKSRG
jgi:small conductance mechanosensitive channel